MAVCGQGDKAVRHPLVFAHPRTQRPGVILGKLSGFVWASGEPSSCGEREADADEVETIKTELAGFVDRHAATSAYRHEWRAGDIVLVDNLAVAHLAPPETQRPPEKGGLRVLHRIVVGGTEPLHALVTQPVR